jgi:formate dehydrogenase major subunit
VQLGRRALDMPGDARQDLWIIQQIANRLGCGWNYTGAESGVAQVYEEMRQAMNSIGGISWQRLEAQSSVTYPCRTEDDPGQPVVFTETFPTKDGRGKFVPADLIPANERPDKEYPFVLITGRQLEHWHTGSMTRRASVLDILEPLAVCSVHPLDLDAIGAQAGDVITVASRRGEISLTARADDGTPRGAVFIPFAFYEAAANLLTNAALDPFGKIAEVKYCAVKLKNGGKLTPLTSYGGGQSYTEKTPA